MISLYYNFVFVIKYNMRLFCEIWWVNFLYKLAHSYILPYKIALLNESAKDKRETCLKYSARKYTIFPKKCK